MFSKGVGQDRSTLIGRPRVVKLLSMERLVQILRVCIRDSPEFEPSHSAHRQVTLVGDGDFEHGPRHPYLARYTSTVIVANELLTSFGGGES